MKGEESREGKKSVERSRKERTDDENEAKEGGRVSRKESKENQKLVEGS